MPSFVSPMFFTLLLFVSASASHTSSGASETLAELAATLSGAESIEEVDKAVASAIALRRQFTEELARSLLDDIPTENKIRICYVLGRYRVEHAIAELTAVAEVTAQVPPNEYDKLERWRKYPCIEALAYVGTPATENLIRLIQETEDKEMRSAFLGSLLFIYRRQTKAIIEAALTEATGVEAQRLREALEQFGKQ